MLKASLRAGGGREGMRVITSDENLVKRNHRGQSAKRKRHSAEDEVYFEKLVENARHVEVQILGDQYGNVVHLFERDCTVQRRNQKVIERAPAPYLDEERRSKLAGYAVALANTADTMWAPARSSFLMDADSGGFYFIEVNPRIQVEHNGDRGGNRH